MSSELRPKNEMFFQKLPQTLNRVRTFKILVPAAPAYVFMAFFQHLRIMRKAYVLIALDEAGTAEWLETN